MATLVPSEGLFSNTGRFYRLFSPVVEERTKEDILKMAIIDNEDVIYPESKRDKRMKMKVVQIDRQAML